MESFDFGGRRYSQLHALCPQPYCSSTRSAGRRLVLSGEGATAERTGEGGGGGGGGAGGVTISSSGREGFVQEPGRCGMRSSDERGLVLLPAVMLLRLPS